MDNIFSVMTEFELVKHAQFYNLADKNERLRSHNDLVGLFHALIKLIRPPLFIEAGAFNAQASIDVRASLDKCRIVAFEANPFNVELWTSRIDFSAEKIEYVHSALSDGATSLTFKVQSSKDGEELRKTTGRSSILARVDNAFKYEDVTVPATTIDEFFSTTPSGAALWVDVEGASGPVLKGGANLIKDASMVFIEVEDKPFWEGQWLSRDVSDFLFESGLIPVARDFESPSRVQYNMLFLRRELMANYRIKNAFAEFYHKAAASANKPKPRISLSQSPRRWWRETFS